MPAPRDATIVPYLKAIWILQKEEGARVGVTVLTKRLGKAPATVSQTIRALAEARLIRHEPYGPIELTLKGEQLATAAIRHDRIARAFLFHVLRYPWPNLAIEAEQLSPSLHRELADRLHTVSGSPSTDPYGNPIPGAGSAALPIVRPLSDQVPGIPVQIQRVADTDRTLLERLHELGLTPGTTIQLTDVDHATEVLTIRRDEHTQMIGVQAARKIFTAAAP
ncbi:MAG: metal-dependent transcriptional regulator [Brachybacterium sp.]|uniref:metal-dependent transcriptional regulator n=1 Tax=Microbacterium TaxID=33882 RepID=UPI003F9D6F5D